MGRLILIAGRVLGMGLLGAISGILLGLAAGTIHAPATVAGDDLANEWYPVGVLLIMFVECCVGFLIGAGIAVAGQSPSGRWKRFAFALGGAILGVGVAGVLTHGARIVLVNWADGSELASSLVLQLLGVVAGIGFLVAREGKAALPGGHSDWAETV